MGAQQGSMGSHSYDIRVCSSNHSGNTPLLQLEDIPELPMEQDTKSPESQVGINNIHSCMFIYIYGDLARD